MSIDVDKMDETALFKWNDGKRDRFSDPLVLIRKWAALEIELGYDAAGRMADILVADDRGEKATDADKMASLQAQNQTLEITRRLFNLSPINEETGEGVTDKTVLRLFGEYRRFIVELKKKPETSPSSTQPTDTPADPSPTSST